MEEKLIKKKEGRMEESQGKEIKCLSHEENLH
jgi:hypothetical protein